MHCDVLLEPSLWEGSDEGHSACFMESGEGFLWVVPVTPAYLGLYGIID